MADFAALEQLACAYAEAQELRAFVRKHGRTYDTINPKGSTLSRPFPQVRMLRDVERQVLLLLGRFGLTPADRPGVSAAAAAPGRRDPDNEFT
jgi:phage terminase small subunit